MTRRILGLVLTLLALGAATAQGQTVIEGEAGTRYQLWVNQSKAPTPSVWLRVDPDASRCGEESACTEAGTDTIWLEPLSWETTSEVRRTFLHELGHQFDYAMPGWARDRFLHFQRDNREWREGPNAPNEQFAEAWALCAFFGPYLSRPEDDSIGYDYEPSKRLHARVCNLIVTASRFMA